MIASLLPYGLTVPDVVLAAVVATLVVLAVFCPWPHEEDL